MAAQSLRAGSGARAAGQSAGGDEARLVRGLRAGCDDAYAELVRRYGDRLLAVARRYLGDDEDARDAVQETFLAAFRAIDRFAGAATLGTWLHRIAANAALMILRRRRCRPELTVDGGELGPMADAWHLRRHPAGAVGPQAEARADAAAEARELAAFVRAAIARLPPSHQEVIVLRDLGGLDTVEIAGRLGLSANAVKLRAHRARLSLRGRLAARAAELMPGRRQTA